MLLQCLDWATYAASALVEPLIPSRPAGPLRTDGTQYTKLSMIESGSNIAGCPTHATTTRPAFAAAPRVSIIRQ